MARIADSHTLTRLLLLGLFATPLVSSQACYYPNGEENSVDGPCPNSDLCCPQGWQCLSNGLCQLDSGSKTILERHTCTDDSWSSSECPDFCTYSDGGNEMILQCSDGSYCCDGNGSFDCCDGDLPPGTSYFTLPDGNVVGSVTATGLSGGSTSAARSSSTSSSSQEESTTQVPVPFSSDTSTTSSSAERTTTDSRISQATSSSATSTASDTSNVSDTSAPTSEADRNPSDEDDESSFGLGAIIGVAIGVGALVLLCAIIGFLLYRRHKTSKPPDYIHDPDSAVEVKYNNGPPEIDSSPKAPTNGAASELYGSDPSARYSAVSSMNASTQAYSPTSVVSPAMSTNGYGGGGRMSQIQEKDEPAPVELWGGPVYRPYRPGMENQGGQGGAQPPYERTNAQAYEGT